MDFPNTVKVPPLLQPYVEAWGNQDAEALAACFEEACEFVSPLLDHPLKGRASVHAYFSDLFSKFPGIQTHGSRFFVHGNSALTVTELTVENPSWGQGRYLMTTAQLQRFSDAGLISRMEVYTDVEAAVKL